MKHLISISLFALIITNIGFSQKIGNILEKAKTIKDGTQKLNNNIQNLQENYLYTHNTATDRVWKTSSKVLEGYCGLSQNLTKAYVIEENLDNGKQIEPCEFYVGEECVLSTSMQSLQGKEWNIVLVISKNEKEITIARSYSNDIITSNPSFSSHPAAMVFTLNDSTITCKGSSSLENFKAQNFDLPEVTFAEFKREEEGKIIFKNTVMYGLEKINWNCSFKGNSTHAMKLFLFQIFMSIERDIFAKHLKSYDSNVSEQNELKRKEEFLQASKDCQYCNNKYTGVSYGFSKYDAKNKPCGEIIKTVYQNACCSRKCAIELCKSYRP